MKRTLKIFVANSNVKFILKKKGKISMETIAKKSKKNKMYYRYVTPFVPVVPFVPVYRPVVAVQAFL
ncbi:hypothetical protein BpHYR1_050624 [Brachionus plicatilis]|uniref:Uncharacterized protein n=1 Tax=Brachionus plicatilis TaxID=10195 RepID=A0A3M7PNC9_BRAPC|nr:hypothetical protein BpHYR1_050624 [Brachionus plicatilis]